MQTSAHSGSDKSPSRLSTGNSIGIGVGVGAVAIFLVLAAISFVVRYRRPQAAGVRSGGRRVWPFSGARREFIFVSALRPLTGPSGIPVLGQPYTHTALDPDIGRDSPDAPGPMVAFSRPFWRESVHGITQYMDEKCVLEQGNRNVSPSLDPTFDSALTAGHGGTNHVGRARNYSVEADGGVRLAGGRPGVVTVDEFDQHSTLSESEGSTLPPPYASHFTHET